LRLVIDLNRGADGIEGVIKVAGSDKPQPFSGWLELLRLLEGLVPPDIDS
jgi:hypothetical protein